MGQTFFGLTSEYKLQVHKLLFTLAYFSEGAFTYTELYNMPIYLRTFYLKQLEEVKAEEQKAMKGATSKPNKR